MPPPRPSSSPAAKLANPLALNTVVLNPGPGICARLGAIAAAGFPLAEMWREDLYAPDVRFSEVTGTLKACELGPANLQVIRDFPGTPDPVAREVRQTEALGMLADAAALGAPLVLVTSSTAAVDPSLIARDLAWYADRAAEKTVRGEPVRVAYEALPWGTAHKRIGDAWEAVQKANRDNLGVVVDSLHLYATDGTIADTDLIDIDKIYFLQLSDLSVIPTTEGGIRWAAKHWREFPGGGKLPLAQLTGRLLERGYTRTISAEVFSDRLAAQPVHTTARAAWEAMKQLLTEVSGFSQPEPRCHGRRTTTASPSPART